MSSLFKIGFGCACLAIGLACVACGGDDDDSTVTPDSGTSDSGGESPGVDEYHAGISKVSAQGLAVTILDSSPAPPRAGTNDWTIQLEKPQGTPLDGATIDVSPWMPKHKHGSTPPPVTPLGNGKYELNPLTFTMSGVWEVTVKVTSGGATDSVLFTFSIEG